MIRIDLLYAIGALAFMGAASQAADAADEVAPLPGLDACIAAALEQRPGILVGWQALNDPGNGSYQIAVLTADDKIADAHCSSPAPANLHFDNRLIDRRRFEHYKTTVAISEASARKTAPLVFAGRVTISSMVIDTAITGGLRYEYRMILPSGHHALVQVDAVSGLLTYAEAKE